MDASTNGGDGGGGKVDNVKVFVRCRPLSQQEIQQGHRSAVQVDKATKSITVISGGAGQEDPPKCFSFDDVFDSSSDQITIYNTVARPIVENCLKGYNGTIFAYGQTGTGKTYTMSGLLPPDGPTPSATAAADEQRGIIPNSFAHIFDHISKCGEEKTFLVLASYLEIYNEEIRDLLVRSAKPVPLEIKERLDVGVYVKDLKAVTVENADHLLKIVKFGDSNRHTGATSMNERSSRSHALFTVTIECSEQIGGRQHITKGCLHLVDLAGSERQAKTGATGERFKEATKINLSLANLGNCISALVDGKGASHIPYRNSKLTRLLQSALGGNCKAVMIANIGPASYNYDETLSTLRYANRAKNIKNQPKINEDPKDALLRRFQDEIEALRRQLENEELSSGAAGSGDEEEEDDEKTLAMPSNNNGERRRLDASNAHYEGRIREMEQSIEAGRQKLVEESGMVEAERLKLADDLRRKEAELRSSREEHQRLVGKLAAIEKHLIVGGENLLEKAEKQALLLEQSNRELERMSRSTTQMQRQLESRQEEHVDIEGKYSSLQEEALAKTRKLKRAWINYTQAKGELRDMESEHQRSMEDVLENVRELRKELLFSVSIIDEFIPEACVKMIEEYVLWNEEIGEWQLKCIAYTRNNLRKVRDQHVPVYKGFDAQLLPIAQQSYADVLGVSAPAPAPVEEGRDSPNSTVNFRMRSAAKDRNAARIRTLLE